MCRCPRRHEAETAPEGAVSRCSRRKLMQLPSRRLLPARVGRGVTGTRSRALADPEVVKRVVEVLAAGLLRARWLPLLVDVGPKRVLGAEERARGEVEDQVLVRGQSVGETGRPRQRRQADARRKAEQLRREPARLDAGPPGRRQLARRYAVR